LRYFRSKSLECLQLKKEWQLSYEILPNLTKEKEADVDNKQSDQTEENRNKKTTSGNFIAVYTAFTETGK
jgi:hypothetical protein